MNNIFDIKMKKLEILNKSRQTIEEISEFLSSFMDDISCFMDAINAGIVSPESMDRKRDFLCNYANSTVQLMRNKTKKLPHEQSYPYTHSVVNNNDEDELFMEELYGSPQMMMEYQNKCRGNIPEADKMRNTVAYCMHCGNAIKDGYFCSACGNANISANAEDTIQLCLQCGGANHLAGRYCIYCGNEIRKRTAVDPPLMANAYAAAEKDSEKEEKKIFKRLFKRR